MLKDTQFDPYMNLDSYNSVEARPSAFLGGTEDARGDIDGDNSPFTVFTVTGDVLVRVFGVCTVALLGDTATLELGTANNTAALVAQTTATDIDANEIWLDGTPATEVDLLSDLQSASIIANGANIVETAATANITAGNIYYVCLWRPLTAGSTVVSAV